MADETKHSPEPWRADDAEARDTIVDAKGDDVVYADDYSLVWDGWGPDSRRRIVACVNALAGIPTEALEAGAIRDLLRAARVVADEEEPAACWRLGLAALRDVMRRLP